MMDEPQLRQLMIADENEGLEFKKALLSRKEIAEYAVGIGNESSGWLVMGVTNRRPRRVVGIDEQSAADKGPGARYRLPQSAPKVHLLQ